MLCTCEGVVIDWLCQTVDCLIGTTAMLLCKIGAQTCDARLWCGSQNRAIFTLFERSCGCFRLYLEHGERCKVLININYCVYFSKLRTKGSGVRIAPGAPVLPMG